MQSDSDEQAQLPATQLCPLWQDAGTHGLHRNSQVAPPSQLVMAKFCGCQMTHPKRLTSAAAASCPSAWTMLSSTQQSSTLPQAEKHLPASQVSEGSQSELDVQSPQCPSAWQLDE